MPDFINILLGIQIGLQLVAAYFVFKIAIMKATPQLYYAIVFNLLLMTFIRIDFVYGFISSPVFRFCLWTLVSAVWMASFAQLYSLMKAKLL